jgi:hypothetical protein
MPPIAKKAVAEATAKESFIKVGDLVNLVSGGRTLPSYEILGWDDKYIKFRGSLTVAPQTEIVLIPHEQIEAMGLVGQR